MLDTLHRVLVQHGEQRLQRPRLVRKGTKRYSRPVPGDRVQMECGVRLASVWKGLTLLPVAQAPLSKNREIASVTARVMRL
jgi:hypothetical protein